MQSCYSLQYLCRRMFKKDCPLHVPNPSVLCTNLLVIDSKLLYLNCLRMQRKFQFRIINIYTCITAPMFSVHASFSTISILISECSNHSFKWKHWKHFIYSSSWWNFYFQIIVTQWNLLKITELIELYIYIYI